MQYRSRSQNGLRPPKSVTAIDDSDGIFVHWTSGPATQTPAEIQRYHMDVKGWTDIAYSWLVDQTGTIHEGRGWGRAGGHTQGYNSTHHAVCAILGPNDGPPTPAMLDSLSTVIDEHHRRYGPGTVRPHNAVIATACPGPDLTPFANTYTTHSSDELTEAEVQAIVDQLKQNRLTHIRQSQLLRETIRNQHAKDRAQQAKLAKDNAAALAASEEVEASQREIDRLTKGDD